MDETRVTIEPGDDDTAESLLALMTGDPQLMTNTMADVIDTTAWMIKSAENGAAMLTRLVDELNGDSRAMIELMCDVILRQRAAQTLTPFIDWVANEYLPKDDSADFSVAADPLANTLLMAADKPGWQDLTTFLEYREYLNTLRDTSLLSRFEEMWAAYTKDAESLVGSLSTATTEYQYGVEIRWPDGTTERHPSSTFGLSRYDAEFLVQKVHQPGTAVLQRRLAVNGPWVDVPLF